VDAVPLAISAATAHGMTPEEAQEVSAQDGGGWKSNFSQYG